MTPQSPTPDQLSDQPARLGLFGPYRTPVLLVLLGVILNLAAFSWVSETLHDRSRVKFDHDVTLKIHALKLATQHVVGTTQFLRDTLQQTPDLKPTSVARLVNMLRQEAWLVAYQWWHKDQLLYEDGELDQENGLRVANELRAARQLLKEPTTEVRSFFRTDASTNHLILGRVHFHRADNSHLFLSEFNLTEFYENIFEFQTTTDFTIGGLMVYNIDRPDEPLYTYHPETFDAYRDSQTNTDNLAALSYDQLVRSASSDLYSLAFFEILGTSYVFAPKRSDLHANDFLSYLILSMGLLITGIVAYLSYKDVEEKIGISRDIALRKESEERYELVAESIEIGIWEHDPSTREFYLSERLKNLLAIKADNQPTTYRDWVKMVHQDYREELSRLQKDMLNLREPQVMEYKAFRTDGSQFWARMTIAGKWNESNKLERVVGTVADISGIKGTQKELTRSNQELDNFAYIASHDLKEPLRAIFNHSQFLKEDYADLLGGDGKQRIERMQFLVKRMEKLISDLLYFARLGRAEEKPETTDLNLLVREVSELYEDENTIIDIAGPLPVVSKDRQRLSDLFRNLIANGVKYNTNELKQIVVGTMPPVAGEKELTLYVEDNGIGIEKRFFVDIFKIFKRLHRADEYGDGSGTGSGLTFAKKIVEEWGGKIWVLSEVGKGTMFCFTLGAQMPEVSERITPEADATHLRAVPE